MSGNVKENPLVSILTPSYNQGYFIKETIESILMQDHPNVEHIVVDGGSTDGTLELLREYAYRLGSERFRFVSEPDRGQAHALNKGLAMARGELIGWLNSDDTYLPGAVSSAIKALHDNPEWAMAYGNAYYIDEHSRIINFYPVEPYDKDRLYEINMICQPAAFFRKSIALEIGGLDDELYFCMDYDLWIRMAKRFEIGHIDSYLANARLHASSKNVKDWLDRGFHEVFRTSLKQYGSISNYWLLEFIGSHIGKGASWLIHQLKAVSISGSTPHITAMNQYDDNWAPPRFRMTIEAGPEAPLHTLILKGTHKMAQHMQCGPLHMSVSINGEVILERYTVARGSFALEIPVHCKAPSCLIEIVSENVYVPQNLGMNDDSRELSFQVNELIPLSPKEYDFYGLLRPMQ